MKILLKLTYTALALIITISCGDVSPTVELADLKGDTSGTAPGYIYPQISALYPGDGSTNIPVNTKYVVVFSTPIDPASTTAGITISSAAL